MAPLCEIGVAIAIELDQLWPGSPGMFEGKRSVTVGTFHDTSPMSSEPPVRICSVAEPRIPRSWIASPLEGPFSSRVAWVSKLA